MTFAEAMAALEAAGNETVRREKYRAGAGENQFGVMMGDIRKLGKQIGPDPALAEQLWVTGNADAMMLATLLMKPKQMSLEDIEAKLRGITSDRVVDMLGVVIKAHPDKESVRERWMADDHPMVARQGWNLSAGRVNTRPDGLDIPALLDRIEREMPGRPPATQWTMNYCLVSIGIEFAEHRERAVAIGDRLAVFKDFPVSKGCVSPFAPIWISHMVNRKS